MLLHLALHTKLLGAQKPSPARVKVKETCRTVYSYNVVVLSANQHDFDDREYDPSEDNWLWD